MNLYQAKIRQFLKDKLLFGNELNQELSAILSVYLVQGILSLARLAVSFFLKDDLSLSPAEVAGLTGIASIPWIIKPVFGFISDGLPIFGYRRRFYLVLSGILGCSAWLGLATWVNNAFTATLAILLASLSVALSDVIVDSIVVERARKESLVQSGSLQSLTWGTSALGSLVTAYLSGWLLQEFGTRAVFGITAVFPVIVAMVAWLIAEEKAPLDNPKTTRIKSQITQVWAALTQKAIWAPTLFIFLWQATPSADSAFFFFSTNELHFTPEFLGRLRFVTSLASIVGIWIYQRFLKGVSFRLILGWTTVMSSVLGMTGLILVTHANRAMGIDDHWFSLGDSMILTVMGQISFMPVLILSARLCPPGIEATLFALLMSIINLSGLLSQELGALLTHFMGITETNFDLLWLLVAIANITHLFPLALINLLPEGDPEQTRTNVLDNNSTREQQLIT